MPVVLTADQSFVDQWGHSSMKHAFWVFFGKCAHMDSSSKASRSFTHSARLVCTPVPQVTEHYKHAIIMIFRRMYNWCWKFKPGIRLRQRQAEAQCGSLSSASVDGATNQATCLRGCCDPSHWLLVDQSEASPRNCPSSCAAWMEHSTPRWNWKILFNTRRGTPRMPHHVSAHLCL